MLQVSVLPSEIYNNFILQLVINYNVEVLEFKEVENQNLKSRGLDKIPKGKPKDKSLSRK